jgi:transcriptional regulator with XRE-family HTH domain
MKLGLFQKEVAERLGLDECTIGNWEKDRTYPAVRFLPRLIHYLGYSPFPNGPTLAEHLRAKREALGLSRKRLASLIGVDEEALARIEWGIGTPTPRLQALVETFIAQALAGAI